MNKVGGREGGREGKLVAVSAVDPILIKPGCDFWKISLLKPGCHYRKISFVETWM